ncbi:MAG: hypothetical protein AAGD96_02615 [Chloroflexota bacterium]
MLTKQETQNIVEGFFDKSLPIKEWTHLAHLIVGLYVVREHDLESSLMIMREGIKAYNVAAGGENTDTSGYHESITVLFVHALHAFIQHVGQHRSFLDQVELLQSSILVQKPFMFRFYSREQLFTVEARLGWVEPKLRPLTDLGKLNFLVTLEC